MPRKQVPHLRLHRAENDQSSVAQDDCVTALLRSFADATGWEVQSVGALTGSKASSTLTKNFGWAAAELASRVRLVSSAPLDGLLDESDFFEQTATSEETAWALLESINDLAFKLKQCEEAVARQEAELAAGLSVTLPEQTTEESLYASMEEALERAVLASGSDAAAVYLLDDTTSTLKMRSCYGLSKNNLAQPPRSLRGALADLEALLGNAVLLENVAIAPDWNCPEPFAAGLCVPIGSSTMPQGTLWLWSDHVRDFCSADIEAAKGAADKILSDIERRVLSSEVLRVRAAAQQLDAASIIQSSLLPDAQPCIPITTLADSRTTVTRWAEPFILGTSIRRSSWWQRWVQPRATVQPARWSSRDCIQSSTCITTPSGCPPTFCAALTTWSGSCKMLIGAARWVWCRSIHTLARPNWLAAVRYKPF